MLPIIRMFQSLNLNSCLPLPASPSKTGGKGEGSSNSRPVSGVKPKEKNLAGYLLAKSAMHQKVEGPTLKHLRDGHETMQQVDELLPLGRANVIPDIEKAKGEHLLLRKGAADKLVDYVMTNHVLRGGEGTDIENNAAIAAAAQHAKTGTCGCFATNILTLHGAKLADMQDEQSSISYTEHKRKDHAWTELHPKGSNTDGTPILHAQDVILDGWSKEKVAILREDSQFARLDGNGKAAQLTHDVPLNHVTGPEALKIVEKFKAQIEDSPFLQDVFRREFHRRLAENVVVPKSCLWDDTSVFHAAFRGQAGKALHQDAKKPWSHPDVDPVSEQAKSASLAEIQAVGVARSMGSNFRGAIADAPGIIASAKEMFPGPEAKPGNRDLAGSSGATPAAT